MSEGSFWRRLQDGKGMKLDECPWGCGNTHEVWQRPEGIVDCYRCGVKPVKETHTKIDLETLEVKPVVLTARQQQKKEIAECLRDDQKRGQPGGGASKGPSRKRPVKRRRVRIEQDQPGLPVPGGGDKTKTVRLTKTRRVELTISLDCYNRLLELQWEFRDHTGKKPPIVSILRRFLTGIRLQEDLPWVDQLDHAKPTWSFQARLTLDEIAIIDGKVAACRKNQPKELNIVSRGAVIEAGVWRFFKPGQDEGER